MASHWKCFEMLAVLFIMQDIKDVKFLQPPNNKIAKFILIENMFLFVHINEVIETEK